ncbi:MAG: M90 family metallopeptidase [Planctomycetota bacterium]
MFGFFRRRRRRKLRALPFPERWAEIVQEHLPYDEVLDPSERKELRRHIQVFMAEKEFEGMRGLEITDVVRVTIAAQACLLLIGRETEYYPSLKRILVYPSPYVAKTKEHLADGTVMESLQTRLGESWHRGTVVLAWDTVKADAADIHDGHNVVMHEFAHQLDDEVGSTDGAPRLANRAAYGPWARVLSREFEELVDAVADGDRTTIDPYGATNPAEFFAVITEAFFEQPRQLRKRHPDLYRQLQTFYRQDPAQRFDPRKSRAGQESP